MKIKKIMVIMQIIHLVIKIKGGKKGISIENKTVFLLQFYMSINYIKIYKFYKFDI